MKLKGHRIYVTPKDIVEGERCTTEDCPVARAVKRIVGRMKKYTNVRVQVTNASVLLRQGHYLVDSFKLPKRVQTFIENFDGDGSFQRNDAVRFNFRLS